MDGPARILPIEAAMELDGFAVSKIRPYQLMFSPIYLYMQKNKKFVQIRNTLDYFSPIELIKIKTADQLYQPKGAQEVERYVSIARRVVKVLDWEKRFEEVGELPPPVFETSKRVMKILRELWDEKNPHVNVVGITAFAQEICGPLSSDALEDARSKNIEFYEVSHLRSGLGVWTALHLGYLNKNFLTELRNHLFIDRPDQRVDLPGGMEVQAIADFAHQLIQSGENIRLDLWEVQKLETAMSQKFYDRVAGGFSG